MALTEYESGSQTTSGTTEHFLGTDNDGTDGVFWLVIDLSDMVDGDVLEIRMYEKARSADTVRGFKKWIIRDSQPTDELLWVSPSIPFLHNRRFSVKATAGTITLPWSTRKV